MVKCNPVLRVVVLVLFTVSAPAFAAGLSNEAELGWVATGGNAETSTFSVKEQAEYGWDLNKIRFDGRFLVTSAGPLETARNWGLGLRYERGLSAKWSLFTAQGVEGNTFSGFLQRYNTDAGAKWQILGAEDAIEWALEGGYRAFSENPTVGTKPLAHSARAYTEFKRKLTETASAKLWVEYIPNFTVSADWLLNAEASLAVALSQLFSIKIGYLMKYDNQLNTGVPRNLDTTFTTALVSKF